MAFLGGTSIWGVKGPDASWRIKQGPEGRCELMTSVPATRGVQPLPLIHGWKAQSGADCPPCKLPSKERCSVPDLHPLYLWYLSLH